MSFSSHLYDYYILNTTSKEIQFMEPLSLFNQLRGIYYIDLHSLRLFSAVSL